MGLLEVVAVVGLPKLRYGGAKMALEDPTRRRLGPPRAGAGSRGDRDEPVAFVARIRDRKSIRRATCSPNRDLHIAPHMASFLLTSPLFADPMRDTVNTQNRLEKDTWNGTNIVSTAWPKPSVAPLRGWARNVDDGIDNPRI